MSEIQKTPSFNSQLVSKPSFTQKWQRLSSDKRLSSQTRKMSKIYDVAQLVIDTARTKNLDPSTISSVLLGVPRTDSLSSQHYIQRLRKALSSVGIHEIDPELATLEKLATPTDGLKLS